MNAQIKARWIEALRSGNYQQGKGHLRTGDAYCCLGVLCDLHARETGQRWVMVIRARDGMPSYLGARNHLPAAVMAWADLKSGDPTIRSKCLSDHNDLPINFDEIATMIDEAL